MKLSECCSQAIDALDATPAPTYEQLLELFGVQADPLLCPDDRAGEGAQSRQGPDVRRSRHGHGALPRAARTGGAGRRSGVRRHHLSREARMMRFAVLVARLFGRRRRRLHRTRALLTFVKR